jgi:hypothetical protein
LFTTPSGIDRKKVKVLIWDMSGRRPFDDMALEYAKGKGAVGKAQDAICFVYDITDKR